MELKYTFPRLVSPPTPQLERRWRRFLAGVHAHEHHHGRIAKAMMRATDKSIAGLEMADNWFCTATRREARRRINDVYAKYEARQNAFDAREHRDGGHVDRLVHALIKN
jgi:predicted secreted Zn-dependent protease